MPVQWGSPFCNFVLMKHCIFRYGKALRLGVAFNRGRRNQSDALRGIGLRAVAAMILGTSSREEYRTVIRSLWTKHLSPNEINHRLMEVCDDGVMGVQPCQKLVQRVRKWFVGHPTRRRLFQSSQQVKDGCEQSKVEERVSEKMRATCGRSPITQK